LLKGSGGFDQKRDGSARISWTERPVRRAISPGWGVRTVGALRPSGRMDRRQRPTDRLHRRGGERGSPGPAPGPVSGFPPPGTGGADHRQAALCRQVEEGCLPRQRQAPRRGFRLGGVDDLYTPLGEKANDRRRGGQTNITATGPEKGHSGQVRRAVIAWAPAMNRPLPTLPLWPSGPGEERRAELTARVKSSRSHRAGGKEMAET
jgi:hypothetical protein